MRSIPMPNAKPEYFSGSIPPFLSTAGWTIPAPMISIQPEPEQGRQVAPPVLPAPEQKTHETATSTPGSTHGKNVGPNRIFASRPAAAPHARAKAARDGHVHARLDEREECWAEPDLPHCHEDPAREPLQI